MHRAPAGNCSDQGSGLHANGGGNVDDAHEVPGRIRRLRRHAVHATWRLPGAATAARIPNVNGIWLASSWLTGSPRRAQTSTSCSMTKRARRTSTRTWQGEFEIVGTISFGTGQAAGVEPGVTKTTNFHVRFVFKSASTAQSNDTTFSGWFDWVERATGRDKPPTGKSKAYRCASHATAKAMASCGLGSPTAASRRPGPAAATIPMMRRRSQACRPALSLASPTTPGRSCKTVLV